MAYDLADFIIKSIVGQVEAVSFAQEELNGKRVLRVTVSQKDIARVMGSRGLVIRAIRTLVLGSSNEVEDLIINAGPGSRSV